MPLSAARKQHSREKILQSAVELFCQHGFDNISIDQVMAHAGLTRGSFYAHFDSKSDLYREAIINAARNSNLVQQKPDRLGDKQWLGKLISGYLSLEHIRLQQAPCPLAFLATDVAVREPEVRTTYTHVYKNMNKMVRQLCQSFSPCDEDQVMAMTAMLIGGVAIGRALDDETVVKKLLASCEATATRMLAKT